jgi:periplasmic protein TonB
MASSMVSDPHAAFALASRFDLTTLDSVPASPRPALAVPVSIALHALVVGGLVVIPALTATELPEPTAVRAFFVEPAATVPPPPPPPPAPAVRSAVHRPEARPDAQNAFVAPIDVPTSVPEKGLDLGVEGGMPGGVEGGVEGGVVGGVVGGLPAPPPVAPVRVGGMIKEPRKIKDVAPEYPMLARQAHMAGIVIIDAIIGVDGRVTEAKVLRGVPTLDEAALTAVRQWAYTPTLLGGVPVPLEMTVTVTFRLTR